MNNSDPVWLRVMIASIPILGALIAGVFALTNTINRRVERLKNLLSIRDSLPDSLNPGGAVDQIILRELAAIDFGTTPAIVWLKRISYVSFALVCISLVLTSLPPTVRSNNSLIDTYETASTFAITVVAASSLGLLAPARARFAMYSRKLRELEKSVTQNASGRSETGKTPASWLDRIADRIGPGTSGRRMLAGATLCVVVIVGTLVGANLGR